MKMTKFNQLFIFLILIIIISCLLSITTFAQRVGFSAATPENLNDPTNIRCKAGEQWYVVELSATGFNFDVNSPESAQSVTEEILRHAEYLPKVIMARPAVVANAAACHSVGINYILYNPKFFEKMYKNVAEIWADRAIFAHELGHFHHNHYMRGLGSTPPLELEADEFAGEVLAKMGATIQQAKAAFESPEMYSEGGHSHPPTKDRLIAVEKGWRKVNPNTTIEQINTATNLQRARVLLDRGKIYFEKKEYDKAIAEFTNTIQLDSKFVDAYNWRGVSYLNQNEYDKALADYNKAIEIDSNYAKAYNNRGQIFIIKKEYDKAIAELTRAIEINPKLANPYANLGLIYHRKNEYDKAIANLTKAIEIDPTYAWAYYNRGVAIERENKAGKYDKAIADYSKAIEIDPKYFRAYLKRGEAYYTKGEINKAIDDYTKAIEINSQFAPAYSARGWAYHHQKGEYDKAIMDFSKAIEIEPKTPDYYDFRGRVYNEKKEYDKAITDYSKAIEIDPKYVLAYSNRAASYRLIGRIDLALADEKKVKELFGNK